MNTYKKIIVVYYMVIVALALVMAFRDAIAFANIITIFSVAIIPVALTALRTKNFWHDDPNAVARLKKEHAEMVSQKDAAIAQMKADSLAAMTKKDAAHAKEIQNMKSEHMQSLAAAARRPSAELMAPHPQYPPKINPIPQ